jgi:hypothetical protein
MDGPRRATDDTHLELVMDGRQALSRGGVLRTAGETTGARRGFVRWGSTEHRRGGCMTNGADGMAGGADGADETDGANGFDKRTTDEPLPDALVDPHGLGATSRDDGFFVVPTVAHFLSESRIPQALDHLVRTALRDNKTLEHILISGDAGSGTTLLARALVRDYAPTDFAEIDASIGIEPLVFGSTLASIGPRGVLLIRHIDRLDAECDQMIGHAMGTGVPPPYRPRRGRRGAEHADPAEHDLDRAIAESARMHEPQAPIPQVSPGQRLTVIATTHRVRDIGGLPMRRFTHTFELRREPRAMARAVARAMRKRGIVIAPEAFDHLARVLGSVPDVARTIGQSLVMRREIDGWHEIDAERMRVVLEDDVGERVPGDHYLWALRRHLGARRLASCETGLRDAELDDEVARIAGETGWSARTVREALDNLHLERPERRGAA